MSCWRYVHPIMLLSLSPLFSGEPQSGWPISPNAFLSRVVVSDLDLDGATEILVATETAGVLVYKGDGSLMSGWPLIDYGIAIGGRMPRVGDIDGDGEPDVVFKGQIGGNILYAAASNGTIKPGWPIDAGSANLSVMHLGDLDGDGSMEIVSQRLGKRILAFNGNGEEFPGFPLKLEVEEEHDEFYFAGIAVGDLDFDGSSEIVVAMTLYLNGILVPNPLFVLNGDATNRDGWPSVPPSASHVGNPLLADLDGDFVVDIIVEPGNGGVYALKLDGSLLFAPEYVSGVRDRLMACADLNGDGLLEVIIPGEQLHVFNSQGQRVVSTKPNQHSFFRGISAGDVDGDGIPEVAAMSSRFQGQEELSLHLYDANLAELSGWPKRYSPYSSITQHPNTAMADVDGDNDLEIINSHQDTVYVWDQPNTSDGPVTLSWAMVGHDATTAKYYHLGSKPDPVFVRGDSNGNGFLEISDLTRLFAHIFLAESNDCMAQLDFDSDGMVGIPDPLGLAEYLFLGGASPAPPFPKCDTAPNNPLLCLNFACP